MAQFRTEVEIPKYTTKLDYRSGVMLIGSCFSENIGAKLIERCFNVDVNPFGILYNPISVANSLEILLEGKEFTEDDIFSYNGIWSSFYHHSKFSNPDKELALQEINNRLSNAFDNLKNSNFLFITFGTAWVFDFIKTGQTVSNCHKLPAKEFKRRKLSQSLIIDKWQSLLERLFRLNPKLNILFTVSPIRHIKDGTHENQLSKSTLLLSIDELLNKSDNGKLNYFPSYEHIMDELRDYRFYSADMVHISETAIDFIWGKFSEAIISSGSRDIIPEIMKLRRAANHIPFNKDSDDYQLFIDSNIKKLNKLTLAYPFLNIEEILESFLSKKMI